jgi:hypothetical protein
MKEQRSEASKVLKNKRVSIKISKPKLTITGFEINQTDVIRKKLIEQRNKETMEEERYNHQQEDSQEMDPERQASEQSQEESNENHNHINVQDYNSSPVKPKRPPMYAIEEPSYQAPEEDQPADLSIEQV